MTQEKKEVIKGGAMLARTRTLVQITFLFHDPLAPVTCLGGV